MLENAEPARGVNMLQQQLLQCKMMQHKNWHTRVQYTFENAEPACGMHMLQLHCHC